MNGTEESKRRFVLVALLSLALVSACQPGTIELTDEQKAEIEQAVVEASIGYTEAYHAEDVDAYMGFASDWAESPWGCCETLDGLRSFITNHWERWDFESFENGEMSVMVLGPEAAVVAFTQTGVQVDTAGVRLETVTDLAFVWVREAGQWKLLVGKQYNHPPGM